MISRPYLPKRPSTAVPATDFSYLPKRPSTAIQATDTSKNNLLPPFANSFSSFSLLPSGNTSSNDEDAYLSDVPSTSDFASLFSDIPTVRHSNSDSSELTIVPSAPSSPGPHSPRRVKEQLTVPPIPITTSAPMMPTTPKTPKTPKTPGGFSAAPSSQRSRRLTKAKPTPGRSRSLSASPRSPLPPFEAEAPITQEALEEASVLEVFDEAGRAVPFGALFLEKKTIVCFIRHFWCPLCQDYMFSISRGVDPLALQNANVNLIIISNGSPKMIKSYRELFHCPFPLYTDPGRKLYNALGMTLRTLNGGSEEEKGEYVQHGSVGGMVMVLKHAMKMPLGNAGDIKQLGGEFCFGPGLRCDYVHRMTTTRSHTPIQSVITASGVDLTEAQQEQLEDSEIRDPSMQMTVEEETQWTTMRKEALDAMDERKRRRRVLMAQREKQRVLLVAAFGQQWSCADGDPGRTFSSKADARRSIETVASSQKGLAL